MSKNVNNDVSKHSQKDEWLSPALQPRATLLNFSKDVLYKQFLISFAMYSLQQIRVMPCFRFLLFLEIVASNCSKRSVWYIYCLFCVQVG